MKFFNILLITNFILTFGVIDFAQSAESITPVIQKIDLPNLETKEDAYSLDVKFGRLSESQFNDLKNQYNTKNITYDPVKIYSIVDFIPKFAQQLLGKSLTPYTKKVDSAHIKALATQNITLPSKTRIDAVCHSITWQWINHFQGNSPNTAMLFQVSGT